MQTEFSHPETGIDAAQRPDGWRLRMPAPGRALRLLTVSALALGLAACSESELAAIDWDMRSRSALNTAEAARQATAQRPEPDDRGVISYPRYQVAVARRGDTVASVAARLDVSADALAQRNAITPDVPLRAGEVLVLPTRVAEPSPATGAIVEGPIQPSGSVDVSSIASTAIARAEQTGSAGTAGTSAPSAAAPRPQATARAPQTGDEPMRHRVQRGETVYSISRLYNVPTRSLAEWNGLGADMALREGQTLLIPPVLPETRSAARTTGDPVPPGQGSPTPEPPSAARPLPAETPPPAAAPAAVPPSPDLGSQRTAASAARFAMPADGPVTRAYQKGRNEGIGIAAPAGSPIRAAADGTVAAITRDTGQVPIVVIRHPDNLLTVYANVADISVARGAAVTRGQTIGRVQQGNPTFLHFEVRRGPDSVDPMTFLQ